MDTKEIAKTLREQADKLDPAPVKSEWQHMDWQRVADEHVAASAALDKATRERDEAVGLLRKLRGCNPLSQDAKNSFIDALFSRLAAPETKEKCIHPVDRGPFRKNEPCGDTTDNHRHWAHPFAPAPTRSEEGK